MFKTQNTSERIRLSRQLEETFISLYDPKHKLSPLNKLRTTRGIMNRMVLIMKISMDIIETDSKNIFTPTLFLLHKDHLKFMNSLFEALRKTNIKLAFTPSKVPPKEYDNMDVLYYHGRDIEKEDPMIVENADDYIYTPTLNSENKDPLPSTAEQTTDKSNVSADPIKLDEDWVSNVKEYLKDKERKVSHPDEDLLIRITKLIFEWCETVGIDPSSAKYHILAELYSMMRRFVMLKKPEKEKED